MKRLSSKSKKRIPALALVVLGACLPLVLSGSQYAILVCCYILIYSVAIEGFDVLVGFSGQTSMGHAAYYCLGAYGSALLHAYTDIPVLFTMIIAAVITTVIGCLIAWPTTKLVAHFMSLATIAFGQIVFQIVNVSPGRITGDANGFTTKAISFFGFQIDTYTKFYYFALIVVMLVLLIKSNILNSRVGRAMIAIRENDHPANGMGINVRFYKIAAFGVSVFFTSYAGAMFTHLMRYISPDSFTQTVSVMFLTMLLFGGQASMVGPFVGVAVVTVLNEFLRPASSYKMLVYGVLLLLVIVAFPGGLFGLFKKVRESIAKRALRIADNTASTGKRG